MPRPTLALLVVVAGCYDYDSLTRGRDLAVVSGDFATRDDDLGHQPDDPDLAAPVPDQGDPGGNSCNCPTAADPCHTDPQCKPDGSCTESKERADGYGYDPSDPLKRCCDGKPVSVNTSQNCGACGISCGSSPCLYAHGPHYYCACSENSDCWSGCCSIAYGLPNVCAAGNCATNQPIACPGNAVIDDDAAGPYYCHY
jgi:hypothetical protein